MKHVETVEQLNLRNQALSKQLDKVTEDLFKAQELATEIKKKLDDRKHSEQLAGWAIDRAIETAKLMSAPDHIWHGEDIIAIAAKYCEWAVESSSKVKP
jgi:uncharacterized Zn finger protein